MTRMSSIFVSSIAARIKVVDGRKCSACLPFGYRLCGDTERIRHILYLDACRFSQCLDIGTCLLDIDGWNVHFLLLPFCIAGNKKTLPAEMNRQAAFGMQMPSEDAPQPFEVCFCLSMGIGNKAGFVGLEFRFITILSKRHSINSLAQHLRLSPFVSFCLHYTTFVVLVNQLVVDVYSQ